MDTGIGARTQWQQRMLRVIASGRKLTQRVKRERAISDRTGQVSPGSGRAAGHKHHPYSVPGVGDRVKKTIGERKPQSAVFMSVQYGRLTDVRLNKDFVEPKPD